MTRCPYCFTPVEPMRPTFACVGSCPGRQDGQRWNVLGVQELSRPLMVAAPPPGRGAGRPTSWSCPTCKISTSTEVCSFCHSALPPGWHEVETTCVAMAGARRTGKSVYIGVLRKQLDLLAASRKTVVGYLDAEVQAHYQQEYEKELFDSRNLMRSTSPVRRDQTQAAHHLRPLVFMMGPTAGRRSAVVIRDVAGEDLETGDCDPGLFGFFRRADAVFFLFDPLQVNAIAAMLRGQILDPGLSGGDPLAVLQNLIRLMRGPAGGTITVPLGVVLSKFDALQELRAIQDDDLGPVMRNTGAAFLRDPGVSSAFDQADLDLLDVEVRSLLTKIGGESVVHLVDSEFANRRFFAASALGHPAGDNLQSPLGIAPFRCLDPLRWAFTMTAEH